MWASAGSFPARWGQKGAFSVKRRGRGWVGALSNGQRTKLSPGGQCCRPEGTTVPGWRAPWSAQELPAGSVPRVEPVHTAGKGRRVAGGVLSGAFHDTGLSGDSGFSEEASAEIQEEASCSRWLLWGGLGKDAPRDYLERPRTPRPKSRNPRRWSPCDGPDCPPP